MWLFSICFLSFPHDSDIFGPKNHELGDWNWQKGKKKRFFTWASWVHFVSSWLVIPTDFYRNVHAARKIHAKKEAMKYIISISPLFLQMHSQKQSFARPPLRPVPLECWCINDCAFWWCAAHADIREPTETEDICRFNLPHHCLLQLHFPSTNDTVVNLPTSPSYNSYTLNVARPPRSINTFFLIWQVREKQTAAWWISRLEH